MHNDKHIIVNLPSVRKTPVFLRQTGNGPVILCVHGWLTSGKLWTNAMKSLESKYTIIALDLPGFGDSPAVNDEDISIDQYAEIVGQIINNHLDGRKPFAIAAHSLGSIIALELLKKNSITSGRLLLSGCPFDGLPPLFRVFAKQRFITLFLKTAARISGKVSPATIKLLSKLLSTRIKHFSYSHIREALRSDPKTSELLYRELLLPRFHESDLLNKDITDLHIGSFTLQPACSLHPA